MYTHAEFLKRHASVSSAAQWIFVAQSYDRDAETAGEKFFNRRNVDISNGFAARWQEEAREARTYATWARDEASIFRAPSTMTITPIDDPRPLMARVVDRVRSVFGL